MECWSVGVLECWSTAPSPNCIRRGGLGMLQREPLWRVPDSLTVFAVSTSATGTTYQTGGSRELPSVMLAPIAAPKRLRSRSHSLFPASRLDRAV